jgi:hypothetical protein
LDHEIIIYIHKSKEKGVMALLSALSYVSYFLIFAFDFIICLSNPCALWLIVVLLAHVAVCLAMSHMCYDFVQGFVNSCIAALVRKVLGGSSLVYYLVKG